MPASRFRRRLRGTLLAGLLLAAACPVVASAAAPGAGRAYTVFEDLDYDEAKVNKLAFTPSRSLLIGYSALNINGRDTARVMRVTPAGRVAVVAGTLAPRSPGRRARGKASRVALEDNVVAVAGPRGSTYVLDSRLMRVDRRGNIRTLVPAPPVRRSCFTGCRRDIAVERSGSVLVLDGDRRVVERVSSDGREVEVVAGGGRSPGTSGRATEAALGAVTRIEARRDGSFVLLSRKGNRRVDRSGRISAMREVRPPAPPAEPSGFFDGDGFAVAPLPAGKPGYGSERDSRGARAFWTGADGDLRVGIAVPGRTDRVLLSLPRESLRSLLQRELTVLSTRAGRASFSARRGRGTVRWSASVKAGLTRVAVPARVLDGIQAFGVVLRGPGGRRGAASDTQLLGAELPDSLARTIVCGENCPRGGTSDPVATPTLQGEDESSTAYVRPGPCFRSAAGRIDCRRSPCDAAFGDTAQEQCDPVSDEVEEVRRDEEGIVRYRIYRSPCGATSPAPAADPPCWFDPTGGGQPFFEASPL